MKTTQKLTTLETRASEFMSRARTEGKAVIQMEWRRNSEGLQAVILDDDGSKCAGTGGGGYDKESQALADVLRFLPETGEGQMSVWHTGGAGLYSVQRRLAKHGWDLQKLAETRKADTFTITRS